MFDFLDDFAAVLLEAGLTISAVIWGFISAVTEFLRVLGLVA